MRILLDMDGVLADFEGRRFKVLQERGLPAVDPSLITDFYGTKTYRQLHGHEAARAARAVTVEPGFFSSMDPIPGAIEGANSLVKIGHDVRICSKPLMEHPNCTEEKRAWILKHMGGWWLSRAYIVSDKARVRADYLIDDRPDLVDHCLGRGEPVPSWEHVLFDQPWNRSSTKHHLFMSGWDNLTWLYDAVPASALE